VYYIFVYRAKRGKKLQRKFIPAQIIALASIYSFFSSLEQGEGGQARTKSFSGQYAAKKRDM
jgi:hypothetical protein